MRFALLALSLAFLLPFFAGCADEDAGAACGTPAADVQSVTIHLGTGSNGKMYMTPTTFSAQAGSKVRFEVVNDDKDTFHDLAILDFFGAGKNLEHEVYGGKTVCTTHDGEPYAVVGPKGSYQAICEVPGHKEAGMAGTFNAV
jgi:uncharacterized cupredoxin-like copper-binding protein